MEKRGMPFELGAWKPATQQKVAMLWGGDLQGKSKKTQSILPRPLPPQVSLGFDQHPKERDGKEEKRKVIPFESGVKRQAESYEAFEGLHTNTLKNILMHL